MPWWYAMENRRKIPRKLKLTVLQLIFAWLWIAGIRHSIPVAYKGCCLFNGKRSLGQGNILTSVCHSFCPQGGLGWVGLLPNMHHRSYDWGGLPSGEGLGRPPDTTRCSQWVGGMHPTGMHACYHPPMKLREGYVFTGMCDSVHRGGAWSWWGLVPGGYLVPGVCLVPGGAWWRPPRDGYCCGQYASYWNAFLLKLYLCSRTSCWQCHEPGQEIDRNTVTMIEHVRGISPGKLKIAEMGRKYRCF